MLACRSVNMWYEEFPDCAITYWTNDDPASRHMGRQAPVDIVCGEME